MGYDTAPVRSEKALFDLATWAEAQGGLKHYLMEAPTRDLAKALNQEAPPAGVTGESWSEWRHQFGAYQQEFGHILYNFDFVAPVPAEDPAPALEAIKMYLREEGSDPHERQERLNAARINATEALLKRARGLRGWAVKKALSWAQSMGEVREDSVASIGLAYPRLRQLLLELGHRLVEAGAFEAPADIFWLKETEVERLLSSLQNGQQPKSMQGQVQERKSKLKARRNLIPPSQLPFSKSYYGIPIEMFVPHEGDQEAGKLKGVGASAGVVTGAAYVLHGPEDFDQMKQGGILVAKMTTPAWTPLFAMAGAVVTDIGGPLSHGSIVAREYGIPAVLGTGAATHVIKTGQVITVDGDAGQVILKPGN
jgi:pyruvate,water dikinase